MKNLFWKEWKLLTRDRVFRVSAALFFALSFFSQIHGIWILHRFETDQKQLVEASKASTQLYAKEAKSGKIKLGSLASKSRFPFTAQFAPGAALGVAAVERSPHTIELSLKSFTPQVFTPVFVNPLRTALGGFDFWGVLSIFLPLWCLALTFSFYSREKDQGTLRQIQAEGGSIAPLMAMKLAVVLTVITFCVLIAVAVGIALTAPPSEWGGLLRSVLPAVLTHTVFWSFLGTLISFLRLPAMQSAILAVGAWIMLNLMMPAVKTANEGYALQESSVRLLSQQRIILNQYWEKDRAGPLADLKQPPEWSVNSIATEPKEFSWGWFFTAHNAADLAVQRELLDLFERIRETAEKVSSSSMAGLLESKLDYAIHETHLDRKIMLYDLLFYRIRLLDHLVPMMIPDKEIPVEEAARILGGARGIQ